MVSQNKLQTREGKLVFDENNFIFALAVNLTKCLQNFTHAQLFELPSNLSTMFEIGKAIIKSMLKINCLGWQRRRVG